MNLNRIEEMLLRAQSLSDESLLETLDSEIKFARGIIIELKHKHGVNSVEYQGYYVNLEYLKLLHERLKARVYLMG